MFFFVQCVDQLTRIQAELQETVKDLAKGKKKYFETEQMAHAVREKADIEAKYVTTCLQFLRLNVFKIALCNASCLNISDVIQACKQALC